MLDLAQLAPGSWVVRAKWSSGGQDYFIEYKIAVTGK
jgi:hypothetical protein